MQQIRLSQNVGAHVMPDSPRTVQKLPVLKHAGSMISDVPEMRRISLIHFVGIGGAGMCGIAEVLMNQGYKISGSDMNKSATTDRLEKLGANVYFSHEASNVKQASVAVVSTFFTNLRSKQSSFKTLGSTSSNILTANGYSLISIN